MRRIDMLAVALGAAVIASPAFAAGPAGTEAFPRIILAQGSSDSSQTGGLNAATPGSPAAGNLGSTPQNMQGRSQQPAQGSAVPLAPGSGGRGANDPSARPGQMQTAPGGTGNMPGDNTRR